eukprot:5560032-Amphidinium_carterae.2
MHNREGGTEPVCLKSIKLLLVAEIALQSRVPARTMVNLGFLDSKCIRFYRRACKKPKRQQGNTALRSLEELNAEPDSDSDASSTEGLAGECAIGQVYFADARLNLLQGVKSM